jgi:hypothetical protein
MITKVNLMVAEIEKQWSSAGDYLEECRPYALETLVANFEETDAPLAKLASPASSRIHLQACVGWRFHFLVQKPKF